MRHCYTFVAAIIPHSGSIHGEERMTMNQNEDKNKDKNKSMTTGAAALISVLAVPVTLLASFLISNKRKK